MGKKILKALEFGAKNADVLLVAVVGVVYGLLGIFGDPNDELLASLTLTLLGVLAFVLLRDRRQISGLDDLKVIAARALSNRPYEVQAETITWDLTSREEATYEKTQRLLFTRDNVTTLDHWTIGGPGPASVVSCDGNWRIDGDDDWLCADQVHAFDIRNGKTFVFCFNREFHKGDAIEWRVTRGLHGRFPAPSEAVASKSATPTGSRRRMKILWPAGIKPTMVQLAVHSESPRTVNPSYEGGRWVYEVEVPHGKPDDEARISWHW